MSTDVTMQELELETAELLPARETLGVLDGHSGPSYSYELTNVVGNTSQSRSGSVTSPSPRSTATATPQHPPVAPVRLTTALPVHYLRGLHGR